MHARWRLWCFVVLVVACSASVPPPDPEDGSGGDDQAQKTKKGSSSEQSLGLADSIEKLQQSFRDPEVKEIRRQYWQKTFNEIRNLTGGVPKEEKDAQRRGLLGQWKLLSQSTSGVDDTRTQNATTDSQTTRRTPRFEGFASWDRLVQDWAEDVQEYLDSIQAESEVGYSFGNFGRPASTNLTAAASDASTVVEDNAQTETTTELDERSVTNAASNASSVAPEVNGAPLAETTSLQQQSSEEAKKERIVVIEPAPRQKDEPILPHTDVSDRSKRLLVVTTAAWPWRTGTAINPLLRAAYLTKGRKEAGGSVTLMLPWLERPLDQSRVYGNSAFETPEDQEEVIRTWLRDSADMPQASEDLIIRWYTAWQNPIENSIYSMGDITALIPSDSVDICILEEPEHLNWYRAPGESWTLKFKHVVGILHTNYFSYALDQPGAFIRAPGMRLLCSWMCRAHCHRLIKLSGTLDPVAPEKELVENVHGVRGTFLDVGAEVGARLRSANGDSDPVFGSSAEPTVYFLGKLLWSKGLGSLMELLKYAEESAELKVSVDIYGGGPDEEAAQKRAESLGLDMPFLGPLDHADLAFTHKVFVNPSTSEVLCTSSAEALAMGKFVILPSHPSNDFFAQFSNCLTYTTPEEFVGNLYYALTHSPEPLTKEFSHALTWEAATERLEAAACIPEREAELTKEAGVEIVLPPLVDSEEQRRVLAESLHSTRERYRQFRTRLSNDIQQSKVLPKQLRDRLVKELDRRLEFDIDEILASPKLRLQLSPAELDKSLLDFYNTIAQGSSGDLMRVIGGGGRVGLQNFYMKRKAARESRRKLEAGADLDLLPAFVEEVYTEEKERSATQWVQWALSRNLPRNNRLFSPGKEGNKPAPPNNDRMTPRMHLQATSAAQVTQLTSWSGLRSPSFGLRPPSRTAKFSLLI